MDDRFDRVFGAERGTDQPPEPTAAERVERLVNDLNRHSESSSAANIRAALVSDLGSIVKHYDIWVDDGWLLAPFGADADAGELRGVYETRSAPPIGLLLLLSNVSLPGDPPVTFARFLELDPPPRAASRSRTPPGVA